VQWGLIDKTVPRSRFAEVVTTRAKELAAEPAKNTGAGPTGGITLEPLAPVISDGSLRYRFVEVTLDRAHRLAHLTVTGPGAGSAPKTAEELHAQASRGELWALRAFRELDDAILRLRFHEPTIGLLLVHTRGELAAVVEADAALWALRDYWLGQEVLLNMARVLRRIDQTSRSFFAIGEPASCFGGCLLELLLAADRSYCLDNEDQPVALQTSALSAGALPVLDGRTRLQLRCYAAPDTVQEILDRGAQGPIPTREADELGLVTVLLDELDFDDSLRLAIEERVSMSPDALTGMEQNLRFPGAEASDCKIFGRLSAWQNWIFIRENATGEKGALSSYGKPERASFDWRRT
jgi:benzoyl-CoA-dihydrodiol lyase